MSTKLKNLRKIKFLLTQGSKGGVGKTLLAAQLATYLHKQNIPFVALDLDSENRKEGGLNHYINTAHKIDLHTIKGFDAILEHIENGEEIVLVDMPAATGQLFFQWFSDMYLFCQEQGIEFVFFCLITSDISSVTNTLNWVHQLSDKVTYVVVKNPLGAEHPRFEFWSDEIVEVGEFRAKYQPVEIGMPSIRSDIMPYLTEHGLTLDAALEDGITLPPELDKLYIRGKLRKYRDDMFAEFDRIKGMLL
jgi:hypothetical protein